MIANERRQQILLVAVYLMLAVMYSAVTPLFESPDEVWHYEYIRWLAAGKGLAAPEDVGVAPWAQEGSQPPLYYLLGAAITAFIPAENADAVLRYNVHTAVGNADAFGNKNFMLHGEADAWPWRGVVLAAHITRLLSVTLGGVTVALTFLLAQLALPGWPAMAVLATALVAFSPQFLFISASTNNDNLVTALATVTLYLCARLLSVSTRPVWWAWVVLGVVMGLAALAKLSGLLLVAPVAFTLAVAAWRARSWRNFWQAAWLIGGVVLLVAGWWYLRNWLLFGDALLLNVMFAGVPPQATPATLAELLALAPGVWRSMWAVFGWFNVLASPWLYHFYTALSVLAVVGWGVGWMGRRRALRTGVRPAVLTLLILWLGVMTAAVVRWAQISYAQGRLLFPALAALATLLAGGLMLLAPLRWQRVSAWALTVALAGIAAVAPFLWILPAYPPPPLVADASALPAAPTAHFDAGPVLLGATLSRREARAGDAIDVTLYWRTERMLSADYSVFVHAVDRDGIVQAQHDSHPGLGAYPTRVWRVDEIIADTHRLTVPAGAPAPSALRIVAGLYDAATGQRLASDRGDAVTLGEVLVLADADALPGATYINFDNQMALVGFKLDRRTLQPGETLHVTLWWEGLAPMVQDYVVFVHLLLPPDAVWAQQDQMPQAGAAPTSTWQVGERIEDTHQLTLPPEAPAGVYRIEVGVYDKDTLARLPVDFSDQGVVLAQVKVE
ncbi:MAG TPA: phospholipid carrier-dependent glycosyltransferase [Chloroflexi bacterium]|nr:phospholipid carrier-dependent glycosyltransferase [Chloroflexota bacterium]